MDVTEVILWGRGVKGEEAYYLLNEIGVNTLAVIDSNVAYCNTKWHGISVINFKQYLENFADKIIIVTPNFNGPIIAMLENSFVNNYILLSELLNRNFKGEMLYVSKNKHRDFWVKKQNIINRALCYQLTECHNMIDALLINCFMRGTTCSCEKIVEMLKDAQLPVMKAMTFGWKKIIEIVLQKNIVEIAWGDLPCNANLLLRNGIGFDRVTELLFTQAELQHIPIIFCEEGFLCSIVPYGVDSNYVYQRRYSIVFDMGGLYINANNPSAIENLLCSDNKLSITELERAKKLIKMICGGKLSKYNHQPITLPVIGKPGRQKVLIVDQVYGDKSIEYGLATEETFDEMLQAAIKENPDADIIIKTHPGANVGHYGNIETKGNVFKIAYGINPICLLEYVDKVYVCTSQMGFEALMCGKEVHVFGMPFYAGWGVTHDRLTCSRRTKKRSVEEIFYMAYIEYSHYVSYKNNCECEIEQAIDELLELRDEYWEERKKRDEEIQ